MKPMLDAICGNCEHCFPDRDGQTPYGICILDPVFEPFQDDIWESRYEKCQRLAREKRFDLNREGCPEFKPVEIVEESEIEEALGFKPWEEHSEEQQDGESSLTFEDGGVLYRVDFSVAPVEPHVQNLTSRDRQKRNLAITTLAHFMSRGNTEAEAALLEFFKGLGSPSTLDEVHFKTFVLRQFRGYETNPKFLEILLDDLEHTRSNNTTRQWFTAMLERLRVAPPHLVEDRIRHLIRSGIFSQRLKKRIESVLDQMWENDS
ncbi:MAG: hypothetical protein K9K64_16130 [Desulfohalobiaceae bacterium]|nr:hypothetical protein [Desulfohalobiaceae bacterium]